MAAVPNLVLRAGSRALRILHDEGLNLDRVRVLAGASGGPKWLVLSGMDLALAPHLKERDRTLLCIGSSIGSWRMAALAQQNNESAVRALEENYIGQSYLGRPTAHEVTAESRRIGAAYLSDDDIRFMLRHPVMKLAFLAAKSRWPGSSDRLVPQAAHLTAAFAANFFARPLLRFFFERTDFKTFVNRDDERMKLWRTVVERCRVLGNELEELFSTPPSKIRVESLIAS